jgi:hypothetical protein
VNDVPDPVTIGLSHGDQAIERLAQLDRAHCRGDRMLVAAVNGEPRAALLLDGGPPIADPLHPTAELVSLLELRRAQIKGRSGDTARPQNSNTPKQGARNGSTNW